MPSFHSSLHVLLLLNTIYFTRTEIIIALLIKKF